MARAKPDYPSAAAIFALVDGEGRLSVRATPGAREETLAIVEDRLVAKVRSKPKDGEANDAVLALIAGALGIARSRVTLLRGAASREKIVRIERD